MNASNGLLYQHNKKKTKVDVTLRLSYYFKEEIVSYTVM